MNSSAIYLQSVSEHFAPMTSTLLPRNPKLFIVTASFCWHWHYIVYGLVAWQAMDILWNYWWKAPSNIFIASYPTPLGRWLTALRMIIDPDRLLRKAYDSSKGMPFAIPMTDRWIIFVTELDQLQQLECESQSTLSQEDALHELAFTRSLLSQHQVPPEHKGPKSEAFRVTVGVLKNNLRSNIPAMSHDIRTRVREAVDLEVAPQSGKAKQNQDKWQKIRLMPALLHIFTRVNLMVFIGEEQAGQDEVYQNIMSFFWSCATAFPILILAPSFLLPYIGPVATGWGIARLKVFNLLLLLTRRALKENDANDDNPKAKRNITRWITQITKLKDAILIANVALGLLFASAFQVPMVAQFCVHKICKYPEYYDRLRAEALEYKDVSFGSMNQEMPYMDSFIKETARTTPAIIRKLIFYYCEKGGFDFAFSLLLGFLRLERVSD